MREHLRLSIGDEDIVFDADADAFVFLKHWPDSGNELFVLGGLWQVIKRIRSNVDPGLVGENYAWFQLCRA